MAGVNGLSFFQAEDGIRDDLVTGVQTCALPIYIIYIKIMLISSIFDYIYKIIIKQILKKSIICPIFSILIWKDMYN